MVKTIYEISKQMCNTFWQNNKGSLDLCKGCPINSSGEPCVIRTISQRDTAVSVEQQLDILHKWAKEHPVKTYKDVLLERFPNVSIDEKGMPYVCRNALFGGHKACMDILHNRPECINCWNEPYKKDKNDG